MEKTRLTWSLDENSLKGPKLVVSCNDERVADFDLTLLFPNFGEFDEVQKMSVVYGVKQNLSDKTARNKDVSLTLNEKAGVMEERYAFMVNERVWRQPGKEKISLKKKAKDLLDKGMIDEKTYNLLFG